MIPSEGRDHLKKKPYWLFLENNRLSFFRDYQDSQPIEERAFRKGLVFGEENGN